MIFIYISWSMAVILWFMIYILFIYDDWWFLDVDLDDLVMVDHGLWWIYGDRWWFYDVGGETQALLDLWWFIMCFSCNPKMGI